jgi:hypothetical protein
MQFLAQSVAPALVDWLTLALTMLLISLCCVQSQALVITNNSKKLCDKTRWNKHVEFVAAVLLFLNSKWASPPQIPLHSDHNRPIQSNLSCMMSNTIAPTHVLWYKQCLYVCHWNCKDNTPMKNTAKTVACSPKWNKKGKRGKVDTFNGRSILITIF